MCRHSSGRLSDAAGVYRRGGLPWPEFCAVALRPVVWLNSLFLMLQSFVPFPTALMGEYATNALAVSLFGVVMAVNTLLFIIP